MSLTVYTKLGLKLKIKRKPFASGGEGSLHQVVAPFSHQGHVVKLYHTAKRLPSRAAKLRYLLHHPPNTTEKEHEWLIWPKDLVVDAKDNFLGLLMPLASGEKLQILCTPKLPKHLDNSWYRFHCAANNALVLRLKTCYNLALAVHKIHHSQRYVIVDLKPDNVLLHPEGLVQLVDLDSLTVITPEGQHFGNPVVTPEYSPPEYYRQNHATTTTQQQAWDYFSLGVIFYQLLLGLHPFAGSFSKPYESCVNLAQKIEAGLFVHHPAIQAYKRSIPPPHQGFYQLPKPVQQLFLRCFVDGNERPNSRPTAYEWYSCLLQLLDTKASLHLPSKLLDFQNPIHQLKAIATELPTASLVPTAPISDKTSKELMPDSIQKVLKTCTILFWVGALTGFLCFVSGDQGAGISLLAFTGISLLFLYIFNIYSATTQESLLLSLSRRKQALERQQRIFNGIQAHLKDFKTALANAQQKLLQHSKHTDAQLKAEQAWKDFQTDLALLDKQAQQLIDSEDFEYQALEEQYTRALRVHPDFANANSLDAERSALAFALQENINQLKQQKLRNQKKNELNLEQALLANSQSYEKTVRKIRRAVHEKKLSLIQEQKSRLRRLQRKLELDIKQNGYLVAKKIDYRITLFKDQIKNLLEQHQVKSLLQISAIQPNGVIELTNGSSFSIAPLKYYQIHELREWWLSVTNKAPKIDPRLKEQIETLFVQKFKIFKQKQATQKAEAEAAFEAKNIELRAAWQAQQTALEQAIAPSINDLKVTYATQSAFLEELFEQRKAALTIIHLKYKDQLESLKAAGKEKYKQLNEYMHQLYYQSDTAPKETATYQKNLQKYKQGLQRLEEEFARLQTQKKQHQYILEETKWRDELTGFAFCLKLLSFNIIVR